MANRDTDKYSCSRPAFHPAATEEWQSSNKRERFTTSSQYPHHTAQKTPFSLAAWGASPGAAPHLLSSPHSPSLTHLTAPGVPHQHWWDSFTCSDSFGSIAYNIFWRRYKLSFQRLAAWICFTLNMRLHSPLLVSFFFFLNKSKSRDFTGDPSCLLQGCLQWHSLRV